MKKLLADLFAKKEKSRHAAAAKTAVHLPRLRDIHFRSIRARGMFVGSGLVLLAILIALTAYALSLQAYYYSATRASLQAKAETASAFLSSYVDRTYAEFYQSAFNYAENFDDKDSLELQFVNTEGRVEIASTGIPPVRSPARTISKTHLTPARSASGRASAPLRVRRCSPYPRRSFPAAGALSV